MHDNDFMKALRIIISTLHTSTLSTLMASDPDYKAAAQAVDESEAECRKLFERGSKEWDTLDANNDRFCQMIVEASDLSYIAGLLDSYEILEQFHSLIKNSTAKDARGIFSYISGKEPATSDLAVGFLIGYYFKSNILKYETE